MPTLGKLWCSRLQMGALTVIRRRHASGAEHLVQGGGEDRPAVVDDPPQEQDAEVEVLLEHRLEREADGALGGGEARVELVGSAPLEVVVT